MNNTKSCVGNYGELGEVFLVADDLNAFFATSGFMVLFSFKACYTLDILAHNIEIKR